MSAPKKQRLAMVINAGKCYDCKACMIACKAENEVPTGFWRNWVRNDAQGTGMRTQFQPGQCMQCEDPSCVAACPVGATWKRADGVVEIDPAKCVGCANCISACPYGARYRDPIRKKADKCDFCSHRLARGEVPACVETCPTKARVFGDLDDPDSEAAKLVKEGRTVRIKAPFTDTQPNIYYVEGTGILDWAQEPTLPGGTHMPPGFWRTKS